MTDDAKGAGTWEPLTPEAEAKLHGRGVPRQHRLRR